MQKLQIDKSAPLQVMVFQTTEVVPSGKAKEVDNYVVLCKCGNKDQEFFSAYLATEFVADPEKPHRKKTIKVRSLRCKPCGNHRSLFALQMEMGQIERNRAEALPGNTPRLPKKTSNTPNNESV